MNRLADLRPQVTTIDEAKKLMAEIARLTCILAVGKARLEQRITELKQSTAERLGPAGTELELFESELSAFILTHKCMFEKPRKVATEFGSFGLQDVTELIILDEAACLKHCVEKKLEDCFQVALRPVKAGIKARLEAGENIPGCSLKSGDTAVYKVSKSVIETEVEKALK